MKLSLPKDFVGDNYVITPLKKWTVRTRNRLKRAENRQPVVYRLTTKSGKTFKLLKAYGSAQKELQRILSLRNQIDRRIINVPQIIWNDEDHLLIEYIEGDFPDFSSDEFAINLAIVLSKLHNINVYEKASDIIIEECSSKLSFLKHNGVLNVKTCEDLIKRLKHELPQTIKFGISYTDHNRSNFIFSKDKSLWLIDLGAFQANVPLDQFCASGRLNKVFRGPIFKEAYLGADGFNQIYELQHSFAIVTNINVAAFSQTVLQSDWWGPGLGYLIPHFDFRLIQARRKNLISAINNLNGLV